MTDTRATRGAPAKRRGNRGRKPDPRKPARDRFVFALVDWLLHSSSLHASLSPFTYPPGLEPPIGWQDDDPLADNFWIGSSRERAAIAAYNWKDYTDPGEPEAVRLKHSHLQSPAIRTMGAAPGMAAFLLQGYVPRAWCGEQTLLQGSRRLEIKPELDFAVRRLWSLYQQKLQCDAAFLALALDAGYPEPILLQPSTIAEIYKRKAREGCQGLVAVDSSGESVG